MSEPEEEIDWSVCNARVNTPLHEGEATPTHESKEME